MKLVLPSLMGCFDSLVDQHCKFEHSSRFRTFKNFQQFLILVYSQVTCTDWHLILNSFSIAGRLHVFTKFWQGVHKLPFLEHCARWLVQGLAWMSARKWHLKIWGNASCYPRSVLRWWFCGAPSKKRFRNLSPIAKHISLLVSNTLFEGDIYLLGSIANVALIQDELDDTSDESNLCSIELKHVKIVKW